MEMSVAVVIVAVVMMVVMRLLAWRGQRHGHQGDRRRAGRSARCVHLAGAVVLLAAVACGPRGDTSAETSRLEADGRLAGGLWSELPESPLSDRAGAAVVWAGDRLVVWGGTEPVSEAGVARLDGATWSPETGWRPMAPAPASQGLGFGGFAVWTGQEVVLGPVVAETGDPAATALFAYAPTADSWRHIPTNPDLASVLGDAVGGFRGAVAPVGHELIIGRIGGGEGAGREPGRLVGVDPVTGQTRPLDPGPFDASPYSDLSGEVLVATVGDRLLAVPNWAAQAWLLEPSGQGSWTQASPPPVHGLHLNGPVWMGDEAAFPRDAVALDPTAERWRLLAPPPTDLPRLRLDGDTGPIAAGDQIVSRGAGYDTRTDVWYPLASLPLDPEQVLLAAFVGWTGDSLVIFGGGHYTCPLNATCDVDPESVDWTQRGWVLRP